LQERSVPRKIFRKIINVVKKKSYIPSESEKAAPSSNSEIIPELNDNLKPVPDV
jgi:hypothetical protein